MKAHTIAVSRLATAPLLREKKNIFSKGFYRPARLIFPPGLAQGQATASSVKNNFVSNVKVVNNMLLRISVYSRGGTGGQSAWPLLRDNSIASFAGRQIDMALCNELDNQLALMKRGEDIGENQRRRKLISKHLASKPYHVMRNFYSTRLQNSPIGAVGERAPDASFHEDILTEHRTQNYQNSFEQKHTCIVERDADFGAKEQVVAKKLADQVFLRVQRHMRISQERTGRFW